MYYPTELVYKNYIPIDFEKDMLFIRHISLFLIDFIEIWKLEKPILRANKEEFIKDNGYPIELAVIDKNGLILATEEQIGWWNDGEKIREISLEEINDIFNDYDGLVYIDILDYVEDLVPSPILINEKVVLKSYE